MDPESIIPQLTTGISGGGVLFILYLIFQLVFNKKLRTPSDDQARIEFGVKVLQDRLTEAQNDRTTMQGTIDWMRKELDKREKDASADYNEKRELLDRIEALEARNREKDRVIAENDRKLNDLAAKLARGETITLADIFGADTMDNLDEDTHNRDDVAV